MFIYTLNTTLSSTGFSFRVICEKQKNKFAIAENGEFIISASEGHRDLGLSLKDAECACLYMHLT